MSAAARKRIKEAAALRQRGAADPAASAWVSANAGSGKTRVLTDRVARLLLAKADAARILCITYTKSAAAEMSKRLFGVLGAWSTASDAELQAALAELGAELPIGRLGEARSLFAQALETPGGLKIETIHAFCQRVLQRFPIEAGVPPDFEVIDEGEAETLLGEARAEIFRGLDKAENAALVPAIDLLLGGKGEFTFGLILSEGIKNRTKLEEFLKAAGNDDGLASMARGQLRLRIDEDLASVEAACLADPKCSYAELRRVGEVLSKGKTQETACGATMLAFVGANDRASHLDDYRDIFFTDKGELRKKPIASSATMKANPGLDEIIARETQRFEAWEMKRRKAKIADDSIAALLILRHIFAHYEDLKRGRGALDYDDLVTRTLGLLKTSANAWVHYKLDGGIDHVLIDEAQDTSPDQWEIVRHLTAEFFALEADATRRLRSIFAVGDQKQSIYSFQGADPRRFKTMSDHFGAAVAASGRPWAPTELEISFRSVSEVLVAVDAAFDSDAMRKALTAESSLVRHEAERIGEAGLVEIWPAEIRDKRDDEGDKNWTRPVDERPESAPEIRLANRIARRIRAWLDQGTPLAASGEALRAIAPGDILILVRQRGALFYEMQRALNRAQLPVAGTDRMVMRDEGAFLDLDALGRFCLLPEDDLALAEVLKGPFIGLDDNDLLELAPSRRGTLWRALQNTSLPRFAKAREWLERAIVSARTMRPFEFYHHVLDEEIEPRVSARRAFAERLGLDAQDVIAEFLTLALANEQEEPATLQGFLSYAAGRADTIKRDMEEAHGRIRVMTVHGAKGLEAPIVFLIDTCTTPQSTRAPWLFGGPEDEAPIPLLRVKKEERDPVSEALFGEEQARQLAEYQRQLYVAMTRARDRLYVAGVQPARGYQGSWHKTLTEAFAGLDEFRTVETEDGPVQRLGDEPAGQAPAAARLSVSTELPAWAMRPAGRERAILRRTPSALLAEEARVLPVLAPVAGAGDPFLRGRAIHKLLQLLPEIARDARASAARRLLSLTPYRPLAAQHEEIIAEVLKLFDAPDFADVFGPGSRAEVPISGAFTTTSGQRLFISGQIDRLRVTDKQILIVDFKTNRPPPASAAAVPRPYYAQMSAYGRLLAEALPGRAIKAALLFTAVPRLIHLDIAGIDVIEVTGGT